MGDTSWIGLDESENMLRRIQEMRIFYEESRQIQRGTDTRMNDMNYYGMTLTETLTTTEAMNRWGSWKPKLSGHFRGHCFHLKKCEGMK